METETETEKYFTTEITLVWALLCCLVRNKLIDWLIDWLIMLVLCNAEITILMVCLLQFESQTSFGSHYKTRIEGDSMFCDFYNAQQRTYCKRLKVLCPEHLKEPKVSIAGW